VNADCRLSWRVGPPNERDPLRRDIRHVTVLPAVLLGVPEATQLRHHNFAQPAVCSVVASRLVPDHVIGTGGNSSGMGKTCNPNRSSMSGPMLAANTPTRSVPATTVGISRSSLTCTGAHSELKKLSDRHGRVFGLTSMVKRHELGLQQILDGDIHID
jgi:hypothetical protein